MAKVGAVHPAVYVARRVWELHDSESDPHEVYVTAGAAERRGERWIIAATLECDADRGGGEVELRISESARCAYGLAACVGEFERWLNATLGREYRLDAALAMGARGPFGVVTSANAGPTVVLPPQRRPDRLAA